MVTKWGEHVFLKGLTKPALAACKRKGDGVGVHGIEVGRARGVSGRVLPEARARAWNRVRVRVRWGLRPRGGSG